MRRDEALEQVEYLKTLVEQTRPHVASSAPHLLLWGVVWAVAYIGNLWSPWIWAVILPLGMVGSAVIGARQGRDAPPATPLMRRIVLVNIVLFVASLAFPTVLLAGTTPCATCWRGTIAYYPMFVGMIYVIDGILLELRELVAIGGWLMVAGACATAMPVRVALVWMAFAGGGGLFTSGIALQRFLPADRRRRRRYLEAV